ncbi:ABC transporter permease [Enterovibrio paralichthyis]|uniref:ABC transporter permease n=1 Tax=Enterovibrio paralichthyis TaxID=2853805 RepID=UPI001C44F162|nr:ABC transporter permease [Enterovibrio paralichthyis]MBV7297860.1 ABC transporter permease [Enterovibrio paralichthyis]
MEQSQEQSAKQITSGFREKMVSNSAFGPFVGLVLLIIGFSFASEYFFSLRNALNILDQITVLGILALGMTAVIIIGGIDLSVGSVLALSMMVMGWLERHMGLPLEVSILLGILCGGFCGLISGLLISKARLPAFIATLAMMSIARGVANILTDGRQVVGFPEWFTNFSTERFFGVLTITMGIFIVMTIIAAIYLKYRANGRNLYAIGGNAEVARLSGINVSRQTIIVYVVSGLLSGIAAMTLAARLDSSQPSAGIAYELDTIAAVVIGGASLQGGKGAILGTVIGVLIIGVLRNGLNLMGVSPFFQQVVIGVVIAIAVAFDTLGKKQK